MKTVYLTIDDAPSTDFKNKVNFLHKMKIPAIFFCIGKLLEKNPKDGIYAIKKGFILGNHSFSHPNFNKISKKDGEKQIKITDELINCLYKKANKERTLKTFRFPFLKSGGKNNSHYQQFLKSLGYSLPKFEGITYNWYKKANYKEEISVYPTYDNLDWVLSDSSTLYKITFGINKPIDLLKRMDENKPEGHRGLNYKKSNDIIMMHDHFNIRATFQPMIQKLLTKEIKFKLPK